jgi:shikimate dehydrogenase
VLHGAAARELGLDWRYERRPVREGELSGFVDVLDRAWLGLSVTAPLKREAARLAARLDERAELTGAANTLLLGASPGGWNTDVGGIVLAFARAGLESAATGAIAGAGATAGSALVALAELGARRIAVALRSPAKGVELVALGERLGVAVALQPLDAPLPAVDAAVSTLPAAADAVPAFAHPPSRLLDADYARPDGSRYRRAVPEGALVDGREMLLGQAVLQARIFSTGDAAAPLPDEERVVAAMRSALEAAMGLEES